MARLLQPSAFGPVDPDVSVEDLHTQWAAADTEHDYAVAGIELAKRGDWSKRDDLFTLLINGVDDVELATDLIGFICTTATTGDVQDPRFISYFSQLTDIPMFSFGRSGIQVMATASAPLYVALAESLEDAPEPFLLAATNSGYAVSGVHFDEFDDERDVRAWGRDVLKAAAAIEAPYVVDGIEVNAVAMAERVLEKTIESESSGQRLYAYVDLQWLAMWSGLMYADTSRGVATADDVRMIGAYVEQIRALNWRNGVKYFYGYDLDGGPSLFEAPSPAS